MEELKHKILGLINKQSPKIPSMGFSDANYHFPQVENLSINSKTVAEADRPADQEILESIEAAYFSMREDFDICRFELGKLPEVLDCDQIQRDFKNLKQQHQVVSKKVLQLILEHQNDCSGEFEKVLEILEQVKDTLAHCQESRKHLNVAANQFKGCLGLLANYRKRKLAQNLLNNLKMIKHLHNFDKRLQVLLSEEDYAGAIIELKKCHKIATKYRHFSCVAALTYKLQETLENTDGQLDRVLSQTCYHFDPERYQKLLLAYNLLERSEISMIDNLHVHYITAIYNTSLNVVHSYVTSPEVLENSDNSGKNPYKTLCQNVGTDVFIPCLISLCKVLFKIVLSYYQLIKWHYNQECESDTESDSNRQKLDHNLTKIWDDVQRKVSSLLLNADLASYKFDQFVQVLGVVHRLIQVGEEFCLSKSEDLQESIRKQSVNYFKNYHIQRLEELKIFLENEMWEVCPVKPTFHILQLQEFKSLRSVLKTFKFRPPPGSTYSTNSTECCSSTHSQDGSSIVGNYFVRYAESGTPFDSGLDETIIEEDILACENDASGYFSDEESDDDTEELKRDFEEYEVEHSSPIKKKEKQKHDMILTNTTLSVLRQMGKYLQMSRLLKPIAWQVISCMNQLFDFYLYSVHSFFASDLTISSNSLYSPELNITLKKIHDSLITEFEEPPTENGFKITKPALSPMVNLSKPEQLHGLAERIVGVESMIFLAKQYEQLHEFLEYLIPPTNKTQLQQFFTQNRPPKIPKPALFPMVNLSKPEQLHGLAERIMGVESMIFLAKQYEQLHEFLEYLIPPTNKTQLQQFFTQNISSAKDLRKPVYMAVGAQSFDLRQILLMMSKINWEVKEVMSQHNTYIDLILREVQIFTLRLEDVAVKVPVCKEVSLSLWESIAHIITHTLVQGFSEAKKCSNGGRALMQLDFIQFLTKFEKMAGMRPVPHREYVENYIKAYYLPESELEKWIKEHGEYSSKHLFGLVSCACQSNKKTRQRLLQVIEEAEKGNER